MTEPARPVASLSLDLDNQWSYMKTHGDEGWQSFPSYLDLVVPRTLELFDKLDLKITFFIVGQDAALDKNARALARIAKWGHEAGNHSFHHDPWLHLYTAEEIDQEIASAETAITEATGQRPNGFRGPGFSVSKTVLETLLKRGYRYDASTFPTFLGPVARAYYFFTAKLSPEERAKRGALFGGWAEGLRPLRPYLWNLPSGELLEIPVTTMPLVKLPFHLSYILYLASYSPALARVYFKAALGLCKPTRTTPSLLLHPLDFLGGDDVKGLEFFPGMGLDAREKLALAEDCLSEFGREFDVLTMGRHADHVRRAGALDRLEPRFPTEVNADRPACPKDLTNAPSRRR